MKITSWDLMKLSQAFDDDFCLSDYTPEELEEMLHSADGNMSLEEIREKYFEYYDDIKDRTLDIHKWSN